MMRIGPGTRITAAEFAAAVRDGAALDLAEGARDRLIVDRAVVDRMAAGAAPVYGLNTGLGAKLGERIAPADIPAFQQALIDGRAVAMGPRVPAEIGRGVLLFRLCTAARGGSGISLPLFDHLLALWHAGFAPALPGFGSIGAGDLTQNAAFAKSVLGQGQAWQDGALVDGGMVAKAPPLAPKDAMVLVNHGGVSATLAALAVVEAGRLADAGLAVAALSYEGFDANRAVLADAVNALRPAPGQQAAAARLRARLDGAAPARDKPQEPLSFRNAAPVLGALGIALQRAVEAVEVELNGLTDSPAVVGDALVSTPNFHAPALALALDGLAQAQAMAAQASVMRLQRMMDARLSGLPRDLSPGGGASAGMVPVQKTAAALLAEIRRCALPDAIDPAPVSEGVEDMASMTCQSAASLDRQNRAVWLVLACEALVAAQALDLRGVERASPAAAELHAVIRDAAPMLQADRPLGPDIEAIARLLQDNRSLTA